MKVKIKKLHPDAVIPTYAKEGDAGIDLTAIRKEYDEFKNVVYHTGISIEIPRGYVGFLFPRSSNSKKNLVLSNCVGVIDSGYRGQILFKYKYLFEVHNLVGQVPIEYQRGDRVGQLIIMPYPQIEFEEVEELSESERGEGGYGSTGK